MRPKEDQLKATCDMIAGAISQVPSIAVILGSGLGDLGDSVEIHSAIPTTTIPHYPVSTVPGHSGRLLFGTIVRTPAMIFQGRVHYYEQGNIHAVLYPIWVAHRLGIKNLIVTNAAGAVTSRFYPGDLMLIADQINLTNLSAVEVNIPSRRSIQLYNLGLIERMSRIAAAGGILLQKGVYAGVRGPSYETAAEVEMVRRFGGDAVGMSTVLEVELAASLGIRILGLSCITNQATRTRGLKLSHAEVLAIPPHVKKNFTSLLREFIGQFI